MNPRAATSCLLAIILVGLLPLTDGSGGTSGWSYEKPNKWKKPYPDCGKSNQSPINIKHVHWKKAGPSENPWKFNGWDHVNGVDIKIGSNIVVNFPTSEDVKALTVTGPLGGEYCFAGLHFHWAEDKNRGSEHSVNGKKFPAEMHMVHHKCTYADVGAAIASGDKEGLAVLGFFIDETEDKSRLDDPTYLATHLMDVLHEAGEGGYYRYHGSLTTPPCTEDVVWTIFKNPIRVPRADLDVLRKLLAKLTHVPSNDRPIQAGNKRPINPYLDAN